MIAEATVGARFLFFERDGDGGGVGWRLLASNNREIARSPRAAPDLDAVAAQVELIRGWSATAVARLVREPSTPKQCAGWRWQLATEEDVIALGSRSYHRRLECEFALTQFRMAAPTAEALLVVRTRA